MKKWILAARLRTLPLSLSGIILSSGIAFSQGYGNWGVLLLALLTTLLFQVLSNFANDLGDGKKGTDAHKVGEQRAVARGLISAKEMKAAVYLLAFASIASALLLISTAFSWNEITWVVIFTLLGIACIWAAINYTVGESAYGYRALGDVFVYLFFGIVAVIGTYFLYTKTWRPELLLGAHFIGSYSVAVLNLNNMRDRETDAASGKHTLAILLGPKKSKIYHVNLLLSGFLALSALLILLQKDIFYLAVLVPLVGMIPHLKRVLRHRRPVELDSELKIVALSTFVVSLLFAFYLNI